MVDPPGTDLPIRGQDRPEFWVLTAGSPTTAAADAARFEADGFDGLAVGDSQCLCGDPYVALAAAAGSTSRLRLATGVTNPYTRHPAVTAAAIGSLQALSGGRAYLGIGRGDSSMAHLGLAPASVGSFDKYLTRLQGYLRGEAVAFDDESAHVAHVDHLGLHDRPSVSRIGWIDLYPKVPVDVAATGPRVIDLASVAAERVTLAVGGDPERVAWGVERCRAARRAAGLDPLTLDIGAYINVAVHPDVRAARSMLAGSVALVARFSAMYGSVVGPVDAGTETSFESVTKNYDMTRHNETVSSQAGTLSDDFIDRFALVGPPEAVERRLRNLLSVGVRRFVLVGIDGTSEHAQTSYRLLIDEVLSAVRRQPLEDSVKGNGA